MVAGAALGILHAGEPADTVCALIIGEDNIEDAARITDVNQPVQGIVIIGRGNAPGVGPTDLVPRLVIGVSGFARIRTGPAEKLAESIVPVAGNQVARIGDRAEIVPVIITVLNLAIGGIGPDNIAALVAAGARRAAVSAAILRSTSREEARATASALAKALREG